MALVICKDKTYLTPDCTVERIAAAVAEHAPSESKTLMVYTTDGQVTRRYLSRALSRAIALLAPPVPVLLVVVPEAFERGMPTEHFKKSFVYFITGRTFDEPLRCIGTLAEYEQATQAL